MATLFRTRWTCLDLADALTLSSGARVPAGRYSATLRQEHAEGIWRAADVEIEPTSSQWGEIDVNAGRIPRCGTLDVTDAFHAGLLTAIAS